MKRLLITMCIAVLTTSMVAGCSNTNQGQQQNQSNYKAGTYTATAQGNNGEIFVEVTVSDSEITNVTVDASVETVGLGDTAAVSISDEIISTQSLAIDTVSGATNTSKAVLEAVENCLTQAGGDIENLKKPLVKENEWVVKELSTDIVVIGAGGAGMSAAVTSAEAGAKVILLEKTAIPGGTTANGGGFFAADSEKSREVGQEALDVDLIFNKYMEEMDWMADANMVKNFLYTSLTTADWLQEHGVEFHKMENAVQQSHEEGTNGYHKYDDFTKTSSTFAQILENCEGIEVYYETPATELIVNDKGEVTGVLAKAKDGSTLKISASSVIIATGGYVGNDEMVKESLNGVSVNASGYNSNVGDGINMALELGAATRSMSAMVNHTFNIEGKTNVKGEYDPMSLMYATSSLAYLPVNVWLNQEGIRFANEDIVYDRMLSGNAMATTGDYAWFLYNQELIDTLETTGAAATGMYDKISMGPFSEYTPMENGWSNLNSILGEMVDGVTVVKADSLEELAEATEMSKEKLTKTMEVYNNDAKNGVDSLYSKRGSHMYEMSKGPYYAIKVTVNNLCTVGGLRVNSELNVVKNDPENGYSAIKNLYAAGADASAIYSDHYAHTIEGTAQGWAYNSGRLSGQAAVKNAIGIEITLD